jgi:hypothetical protein
MMSRLSMAATMITVTYYIGIERFRSVRYKDMTNDNTYVSKSERVPVAISSRRNATTKAASTSLYWIGIMFSIGMDGSIMFHKPTTSSFSNDMNVSSLLSATARNNESHPREKQMFQ